MLLTRHMKTPSSGWLAMVRWMSGLLPLPLVFLLALSLGISGCQSRPGVAPENQHRQGSNPIQITATVGMVADLVRKVGGDQVQVHQLCGAGVDPHLKKMF